MTKSPYTLEQQIAIKEDIMKGMTPADLVAKWTEISINAVAQIRRGAQWAKVPWGKDGPTGPMPAQQAADLKKQRDYTAKIGIHTGQNYPGTPGWYDDKANEIVQMAITIGDLDKMEARAKAAGFLSYFNWVRDALVEQDEKEHAERQKKHEEDMAEAVRRQEIHNQKLMIQFPGFDPKDPSTHHLIPKRPRPQDMPINAEAMNKLDWEEVERRFGEVPIVVEALASEDPDIKTAIRIMATAIAPDSSQFEMAVRSILKKIKAWQAQNTPHLVVIK